MSLARLLDVRVKQFFQDRWFVRQGRTVPSAESIGMKNIGVNVHLTILYADMVGSTKLVDEYPPEFAASIYKSYLFSAAKIIRKYSGEICSYDGDRIMAVFQGAKSEERSVRAALGLNYFVQEVINLRLVEANPRTLYRLGHRIGIDAGSVLVVQAGIRGGNDLIWVGRAANHAAKLADIKSEYSIHITEDVYRLLPEQYRTAGDQFPIWHLHTLQDSGRRIYCTSIGQAF